MGPNRINNVLSGEKTNQHFTEGEKKTSEHGPAMQVVTGLCCRRFKGRRSLFHDRNGLDFLQEVSFRPSSVDVANFRVLIGQHEFKERRPQHEFNALLEVFLASDDRHHVLQRVLW